MGTDHICSAGNNRYVYFFINCRGGRGIFKNPPSPSTIYKKFWKFNWRKFWVFGKKKEIL